MMLKLKVDDDTEVDGRNRLLLGAFRPQAKRRCAQWRRSILWISFLLRRTFCLNVDDPSEHSE